MGNYLIFLYICIIQSPKCRAYFIAKNFKNFKMNRYFTHYKNWEDYKNGMYRIVSKNDLSHYIELACKCLCNPESSMLNVIINWKESTKENLSNKSQNRKSWLGQAACCYEFGCPEDATRAAWNNLNKDQQKYANNKAKEIIELWESYYLENLY